MQYEDVNLNDYHDVVRMFHSESDRGAAVLAGSFAENFLAKYLRHIMVNDSKVESLFTGFGPLASFSQRTEIAYAFGFIPEATRNDLIFVRKIRNYFAHHPKEASFETSPVSEWVNNLSMPAEVTAPGGKVISNSQKNRYLLVISLFVTKCHNAIHAKNEKAT